jgi:hypothetical protein
MLCIQVQSGHKFVMMKEGIHPEWFEEAKVRPSNAIRPCHTALHQDVKWHHAYILTFAGRGRSSATVWR